MGVIVADPHPTADREPDKDPVVGFTVAVGTEAVANAAAAIHATSYGSTVSVAEGNLLGHSLFAISVYPERSAELIGAPTRNLLFAFVILSVDLLCQPGHTFGTWLDSQRNRHVLDIVVCLEFPDAAIGLGIDHS